MNTNRLSWHSNQETWGLCLEQSTGDFLIDFLNAQDDEMAECCNDFTALGENTGHPNTEVAEEPALGRKLFLQRKLQFLRWRGSQEGELGVLKLEKH